MYSTLLFLDRPRHLRYDMQAVLDLDQLLLAGFDSIFTMEADVESLRLIYWAGLKHEDPHLRVEEIGGILSNQIHHKRWTYENLIKMFTRAVIEQEWISPPKEKSTETQTDEKFTIQDYIRKMEEMNYMYVGLTPKEFYGITPREFRLMMDNVMEVDNRRFGIVCATIANCAGAKKKDGELFTAGDFFGLQSRVKRQTPKAILNTLISAFGVDE